MSPTAKPTDVVREVDEAARSAPSADALMKSICERLHQRMLKYNWVGFYMIHEDGGERVLQLGRFVGSMTPHTRIQLNQGICGAAASTGKTVVVDDVNSDPRYLACSLETKSEIVAPIFVRGQVVGEIDIDSHFPAAFNADDRKLVEHCAALVGRALETHG
ncbi:MAG TPA: GAF domain-containing protein [Terriglobales bacterium]|jgi:GAF domain-containing protein|nr:GAF domain-containing protein [Terriglobales bacterium]